MLDQVRNAGYQGVEFHQPPGVLGHAGAVFELLCKYGLSFVGLAGGLLAEKVAFLKTFLQVVDQQPSGDPYADQYRRRKPYIYVEKWEGKQSQEAIDSDLTLTLHPHMFRAVQTARDAERILTQHPRLRFLPDTAHLTVAGEELPAVFDKNYDAIEAVHLKDWTAEYGRAYQFYSRICGIGQGGR